MADAGFFKGTSAEQDSRFANKQKKLLKQMKFPDNIDIKIDMVKVKLNVIKPWITARLQELLGIEDDVVIEYVFNQLEEKHPDPKMMQINLTGFLGGNKARLFIGELWNLLVSAQQSPDGIPAKLVELKKQELLQRQQEDERLKEIRKREEETYRLQVKIESDNAEQSTNGRHSMKTPVELTNVSNTKGRDRQISLSPVAHRQRRKSPNNAPTTQSSPLTKKRVSHKINRRHSSTSPVSTKREPKKGQHESSTSPNFRSDQRKQQKRNQDKHKESSQRQTLIRQGSHSKKSKQKHLEENERKKKAKKSSKRTRSPSTSNSDSRSSTPRSQRKKGRKSEKKKRFESSEVENSDSSRSRSPTPHRKKKKDVQKLKKYNISDSKSSTSKKNKHSNRSRDEKARGVEDHRQKSISPLVERNDSPVAIKPRLESQIRVQTPPQKRIDEQKIDDEIMEKQSVTNKSQRIERIVVLDGTQVDDCVSSPTRYSDKNRIPQNDHTSSEDENEIDLRERLLREKAIRSMKRRQLNQQQDSQPKTTSDRIVYHA